MQQTKEVKVQRNQKDTIFRMLFREKENLLSLYNAVNKTAYANTEDLEITTLENAVYMNYKNDVSFVFDFQLMLYEHQSTVNLNMPLRNLFYVTDVLQGRIWNEDLYSQTLVKIPAPKFIVFYNGVDLQPEQMTLRLSDAYEKEQEQPELELTVSVYNINLGYNTELLETCQVLKEYAQYVAQVRAFAKDMPFIKGVEEAVDYCIREGILAEFLSKNRAEAIAVSIYEYDEERHMKTVRQEGKEEGRIEGEDKIVKLFQKLMDDKKEEDLNRALSDREYRQKLCREYGIE